MIFSFETYFSLTFITYFLSPIVWVRQKTKQNKTSKCLVKKHFSFQSYYLKSCPFHTKVLVNADSTSSATVVFFHFWTLQTLTRDCSSNQNSCQIKCFVLFLQWKEKKKPYMYFQDKNECPHRYKIFYTKRQMEKS